MQSKDVIDFIVIDDEPMSNRICEIVITRAFPGSSVATFTNAFKAIEYLTTTYSVPGSKNAVVFLDIAMPGFNGWQVLDKISALATDVRSHLSIYILSSADEIAKKKAYQYPLVKKFISKPLLINTLRKQLSTPDR
jgi:CheY-like chemotaxis protein